MSFVLETLAMVFVFVIGMFVFMLFKGKGAPMNWSHWAPTFFLCFPIGTIFVSFWNAYQTWVSRPYDSVPVRLLWSSVGLIVGGAAFVIVSGWLMPVALGLADALLVRRNRASAKQESTDNKP